MTKLKFVVGDYVEGNGWRPDYREQYEKGWRRGYIKEITNGVAKLTDDNGRDTHCVYYNSLREPAGSLSKGTPVQQRCGRPATILEFSDDPDRPILAEIQTTTGPRRLTYSKWGHFYKDQPLPVDLVPL